MKTQAQNYTPIANLDAGWLELYAKHENAEAVWSDEPPAFVSSIVAALKPGQKVLELCCGDGRITKALIRSGASVTPSDISVHALEQLQATFKANGLAVPLPVIAPATNLPFPAESFDVVVSVDGICQIGELRSALEETSRVLKPGGLFIADVFTPDDAAWGQGEQVGASSWAYKGTLFNFFTRLQFESICSPFFTVNKVWETRWQDPPHGSFRPQCHTHVADVFILNKAN